MNEEEKKAIEKIKEIIECFYCFPNPTSIELKDCDCSTLETTLKLIEKLQKENEELKEKENKIYEEVQESLSFEKFLIKNEIEPDSFNQGRFYMSQIIYDILNNFENPD